MALPLDVNLADKFSSKLDQAFKLTSYTDNYVNKDYDFDGVNKIHVYTLDTAPLVPYDMSNNTNRYGGFSEITDQVNEYVLKNDDAFQKTLDTMNRTDSANAKTAANFMAEQMNKVIVPTIDRERFQTAFDAASDVNGGGTETYSSADILDQIYTMNANCDEMSVPNEGRCLFVMHLKNFFSKLLDLEKNFSKFTHKTKKYATITISCSEERMVVADINPAQSRKEASDTQSQKYNYNERG